MAARVPRPEHAFIGNHTFQIEWVDDGDWDDRRLDPEADALTHARHQVIMMRVYGTRTTHETHYQEILLHELTHAAWDASMLTHADLKAQDDAEEFIISLQTPALFFILKHNPEVTKYLLSDGNHTR